MRSRLALVLAFGALAGAGLAQDLTVTNETAFTFYKSLQLLTPEPIVVSVRIAVLCTSNPPQLILDEETRRAGPHAATWIKLYVNEAAKKAIDDKAGRFPSGAVIVKEKFSRGTSPEAIGGMIKRAPGYDPVNGDWEYFYSARTGGFASGRLGNCIECHSQAKSNDHVFYVGIHARK
jgi:hypothetical protein